MTSLLPPPKRRDTTEDAWHNWQVWKREFELFSTATLHTRQLKVLQAATLLMTIGEKARKAYSSFTFNKQVERYDAKLLIAKFEECFKPASNLVYQQFRFGTRDPEEEGFSVKLTELRVSAKHCEF